MTDQRVHCRRADIENHRISRHRRDRHGARRHTGLQLGGHHGIGRQHHLATFRLGAGEDFERGRMHLGFLQRAADRMALRGQERVGHGAADHQRVHLADQVPEQVELGRNLRAPDHRRDRTRRIAERRIQGFQFRLHQPSGIGRQQMRHALGAGVRAMRRGKGVVHIDIRELCHGSGHAGIVLLLLGVVAGVLQHQQVAARHSLDRLLGRHADAVLGKAHPLSQHLAQRDGNRCQRHLRDAPALGAVEVAADDDPGTLLDEFADRRRQSLEARQIADLAVANRHVEVGAQQDVLAGDIDIVEGTEGHWVSLRRAKSHSPSPCGRGLGEGAAGAAQPPSPNPLPQGEGE